MKALGTRLGLGTEAIEGYTHPYLNLARETIRAAGHDPATVARAVAKEVERLPGVARAVSSAELAEGRLADTPLHRKILHNYSRSRSGDIYIVFQPHWMIADFDGLLVSSTHGSPWSYDTFVPVIFAGAGLKHRRVFRRIHTVDVAPSIAAFLDTKPPSGATGTVLPELFAGRR